MGIICLHGMIKGCILQRENLQKEIPPWLDLIILSIEINDLPKIKLKERRAIIIHQPKHMLKQYGIHVHIYNSLLLLLLLPSPSHFFLILLPHHLQQHPKRALLQNEGLHQELPLLLPNHHCHRLLQPLVRELPVAQPRRRPSLPYGDRQDQAVHHTDVRTVVWVGERKKEYVKERRNSKLKCERNHKYIDRERERDESWQRLFRN